jgi:hypothetical protein
MRLLSTFVLLLVLAPVAGAQSTAPTSMPTAPVPYLDWNACPFEGCVYRQWTALTAIKVYDTWKPQRHTVATLSKGDKVNALKGLVVTLKPGVIRMDRDLPDQGLKKSETLLTYAYVGEGMSAVWHNGKYYPEFDISFAKWPDGSGCGGEHCAGTYLSLGKKEWWVEIQLNSGLHGWINVPLNRDEPLLDGMDALS